MKLIPLSLRRLVGLALALAATAAQAVPVSTTIDGLPPGLSVVLDSHRCVLGDFNGNETPMLASRIQLTESSHVEYETVTLPDGTKVVRAKVVTRYSGQADVLPDPPANAGLVACDTQRPGSFVLRFSLGVQGVADDDSTQFRVAQLGQTLNRINPVGLRRVLFGSTTPNNVPTQLARNTSLRFEMSHQNPFVRTRRPTIEFSRSVQVPGQAVPTAVVTRIFATSNSRMCISAGGQTRCSNSTPLVQGVLLHGGVALDVASSKPIITSTTRPERTIFVFGLTSNFVPDNYTVRQLADDEDTIDYLQDGVPTPLNLLEWRPFSSTIRVF